MSNWIVTGKFQSHPKEDENETASLENESFSARKVKRNKSQLLIKALGNNTSNITNDIESIEEEHVDLNISRNSSRNSLNKYSDQMSQKSPLKKEDFDYKETSKYKIKNEDTIYNNNLSNDKKSKKIKKKSKCSITLVTGYEMKVSRAKMLHFKKKLLGLDLLVPKNRVGVLERYEKEYEQNRKTTNKKNVKKYLKKGSGISPQKPPIRPNSAPLYKYVWNEEGELYVDKNEVTKSRKPVANKETASTRIRKAEVAQHLNTMRVNKHKANISFLKKASTLISNKHKTRIRSSSSMSKTRSKSPNRPQTSIGIRKQNGSSNILKRSLSAGNKSNKLSKTLNQEDLNQSIIHVNDRFLDSEELPDFEIDNGESIADHILQESMMHSQDSTFITSSKMIELDDLEKTLDSYLTLNYVENKQNIAPTKAFDPNTLSKYDKKLLERAKAEIQMEKEVEAKKLGHEFSRKIKKSILKNKKKSTS